MGVIESGLAASVEYHQDTPGVHGLWPETGYYGTSQCIPPTEDTSDPTKVYECYLNDGDDLLQFETHEWEKHGSCAGVKNAEDYFTQMCALADKPIEIMTDIKQSGGDLTKMSDALDNAGYAVFSLDTYNKQVKLSACASNDGKWVLAPVNEFLPIVRKACNKWYDNEGCTCAREREKYGCDCNGCECKGDISTTVILT